jgi:hypothetical protein
MKNATRQMEARPPQNCAHVMKFETVVTEVTCQSDVQAVFKIFRTVCALMKKKQQECYRLYVKHGRYCLF